MRRLDRQSLKTTNAEGTYLDGRYLLPSEITHCRRCWKPRMTRADRGPGLCIDCRGIETRIAQETPEPLDVPLVRVGLIWKQATQPRPERMSAEDLAWCEKNAAAHKARRPVIYYRTKQRKGVAA